jgi:hypothetical protein
MSPYQRTQEVWELEEEMYDLPPIPAEERQKPLRNVLQFVLRGLQVPSSMISGFAWQLLDKQPGFDTREFLEWTFGKDQGTWGDVIQELAARNPNDNFWDRRVAQVAFGLALDIALDPLNFLGGGVVKSIGKIDDIGDIARAAGKAAKNLWDNMGVAKTLGRKNPQLGNRIARNLENIMSGRGVGFQINPLGRTLDVPLTRQARFAAQHQDDIARLAGKMSRQGAMGGAGGIAPQAAEKVLQADPFFQTMYKMAQRRTVPQMVDDFLAYVPIAKNLYRPLRKAFASGKTAFTRALETRELLKTRIAKNQSDVQAVLKRAAKEIPGWNKEMSELARQYLQNYKGMLFKNGGAVKVIMLKAKMMSDMISKLPAAKLAGKNHEDFIQGMIKVNEGYRDIITDEIAFILERYLPGNMANAPKTLAEAAKNLPYKQLVKNAEYLYDKNSIRMLESMLTDPKNHLELPFDEELLKMGAYRPLKRKFTETEQFAKRYNELPIGHKKMLDTYMDDVRRMVDKWWDDEMRAGIHSQYRVGYLPSYAPPKGFKKQGLEMGGRFAPFQFHSSHRTSEAMEVALAKRLIKADYVKIKEPSAELIEEVGEEVARKRMMKEALKRAREEVRNGNETFGQVFYTLEGSVYYRGSTHAKQMARKGMVEELAQYGVRYPDDASKLMGYKRVDTNVAPELSEYVFDEDTADIITRAVNIVQDETTNQFMSMVEKATDWWKFVVTSANPGFHLRNFYSNHFLGWLWQGPSYFNPKHHKDAGKLVAKGLFPRGYDNAIRRVFGETVPDKYLDQVFAHGKTKRELLDFARERGLIRREFRFAEMARSHDVQRILKKKIKRLFPYGRDSFVGEGAEIVGSLVENEARVAAFLNQFQKTGDMMGSFIKTQEVFVNYLRRTPFEEQIWKNVMPFWSWAKQNTANMVKFIFLQPRRMSKIPKVAISVENLVREDVPDEFLPDYYEEQWMWQLPINLPDGTPLFFNPDFPIQDLNRLAFDPANIGGSFRYMVSNALGMLGPAIKVPIEQIPRQGYDIFRDRPIEQWPGQKKPLPGVAQHLARLFYDVAPDTMEAIGATLEGGHVVVPAKFAKGLNDLLPFVRNAARWVAANPDKEGVEKVFDTLSYIGGLKVQPLDTLSQEYYYLLNEVKARKEYWRDLGYDV